jgi:hypothetical protein
MLTKMVCYYKKLDSRFRKIKDTQKMRLITISIIIFLMSACTTIKESEYLAPFIKEKSSISLPPSKDIEVSGQKNTIRSENRAVVPYFEIIFYNKNNPVHTKVGEDKEVVKSKISRLSNDLMQKITDKVYEDFILEMKKQGIEILPTESLDSSPTYTSFSNSGLIELEETLYGPAATSVSPTGMKSSDLDATRGKQIKKIMDEMNASVMNITFYVSHIDKKINPRSTSPYSIDVEQKISVVKGSRMQFFGLQATKCEGYCESSVVNVKLGKSIKRNTKVGILKRATAKSIVKQKEIKRETRPSESNLKSQAANLGEKAMDWISSLSEKNEDLRAYELRIDPVKYEKVVGELLRDTTEKLVREITFADQEEVLSE